MENEIEQDSAADHAQQGDELLEQGKVQAARKEWQLAIQMDPDQLDAHYSLGKSYQDEHAYALAEAEFRAILQVDPDDSEAHLNLAYMADERDDWENSIPEYREVLRLDPEDDKTRRDLVWDLIHHGDLVDAQTELERIGHVSREEDGGLWVSLAEAFEKQGDSVHAIAAYKEALEVDPDLKGARAKLKQLAPLEMKGLPPTTLRYVGTRMGIGLAIISCIALGLFLCANIMPVLASMVQDVNPFVERRIVVLQADRTLSESDLNKAASILSQRLTAVGLPDSQINVSAPNQVVIRLRGTDELDPTIWQNFPGQQTLEFVDAGDVPLQTGTLIQIRRADSAADSGKLTTPTLADSIGYRTVMTDKQLRSATVAFRETTHEPYISFELTDEGSQIFSTFTTSHVGKYLAIALNHKVISSPVIISPIRGGRGIIEGKFTLADVQALVVQLNAKPLPADFKVLSDQVGSTFMDR